jgi:LysR family glycine cleavage system transcriptional activator
MPAIGRLAKTAGSSIGCACRRCRTAKAATSPSPAASPTAKRMGEWRASSMASTWNTPPEAARSEVDLALLWQPAGAAEAPCTLPFPRESVFPVAAPKLLEAASPVRDWRVLPLLAKGRRGEETGREWSWATWRRGDPGQEVPRFRDIGSSLQAVLDGNGVALGRSLLVADALREGRLVRVSGEDEALVCTKAQLARWSDPRDGTAERMAAWLAARAGQDVTTGAG